jgi:valyl-tRNA synthetase
MEEYRLYLAGEKLYHYVWHRFADTILEESKDIFLNGQDDIKASREKVLHSITEDFLKALHPFMPFVTEELWNLLGHEEQLLLVQSWPTK